MTALSADPGEDWRHRAACRSEDPELFFPGGTTGPALQQIEQAKAVCRRCSVTGECLAWALDSGQEHGVWGGLGESERRAMKRRRRRTAPAQAARPGRLLATEHACAHGHPWTEGSWRPRADGTRRCRVCERRSHSYGGVR